ncbi:MAG: hypothetical protein AAB445_02975 [Patescibacteria group bacterium]
MNTIMTNNNDASQSQGINPSQVPKSKPTIPPFIKLVLAVLFSSAILYLQTILLCFSNGTSSESVAWLYALTIQLLSFIGLLWYPYVYFDSSVLMILVNGIAFFLLMGLGIAVMYKKKFSLYAAYSVFGLMLLFVTTSDFLGLNFGGFLALIIGVGVIYGLYKNRAYFST